MIKHNELALRLNSRLYKDTNTNIEDDNLVIEETLPIIIPNEDINPVIINSTIRVNRTLFIELAEFILNVITFGYAAQFLLNTSWPIFGIIAVGYTINFIFNKILFLFSS